MKIEKFLKNKRISRLTYSSKISISKILLQRNELYFDRPLNRVPLDYVIRIIRENKDLNKELWSDLCRLYGDYLI